MSDTSSQLDPWDPAYRYDTKVTEIDRPIASTSGIEELGDVRLPAVTESDRPASGGAQVVTPTSRVNNAFEMALWVAILAPRELIDRAERMQIDTGLPTCDIQNEV